MIKDMRPSRVLRKLRAGEVAISMKMNLKDARAFDIAARSGFDCLWTGLEHIANDWSDVEHAVYVAKAHDVDLLCRVARGSYSDYIRPLELDAAGIMVPHVMGAEDAREVVRRVRFAPVGRRALDGGNADGAYCNLPVTDYLEQANRERFVILQIEDPEAMEVLDDIAAVEGYDMLFFGASDYSNAIGLIHDMNHPRIQEARKRVVEAARAHGKFAGCMLAGFELRELVEMGYSFINVGCDVVGLSEYCRELAIKNTG